jgi:hypothetical protein
MQTTISRPFDTVPKSDYYGFGSKSHYNYAEVVKQLGLKKEDIAKATGTLVSSVRYDGKISQPLQDRIFEWGTLLNLVAQHFEGDLEKTLTWFAMPNPHLGNGTPRDMIRFGRYPKLLKFVINAIDEGRR